MSQLTNVQNIAFSTAFDIDRVIAVQTFTLTENDVAASYSDSVTFTDLATDLSGQYCPFIGVFSYDGGTTWNDLVQFTHLTGFTIDPVLTVYGYTKDNVVRLELRQTALINGGNPYTLTIKIALLAPTTLTTLSSPSLDTTALNFNSSYNYQKIAIQDSYTAPAGTNRQTIAHNLGYKPLFFVVYKDTLTDGLFTLNADYGLSGSILNGVEVDSTNIYVNTSLAGGDSATVYYTIYHEDTYAS